MSAWRVDRLIGHGTETVWFDTKGAADEHMAALRRNGVTHGLVTWEDHATYDGDAA